MANSINSFKEVWRHPYNQKHPFDAFFRVSKWCVMKKIFKHNYTANFQGYKVNMWLDSSQSRFLAYFCYLDWEEFNFIENYLKAGDHVFDVGANIGLYTLLMVKCVGPTGRVTSLEPDEKCYKRLLANIEANELTNVIIEKLALSNSSGKLNFSGGQDVLNHIDFQPQLKQTGHIVDAVTLDQYCNAKNIKHIALLKIDIEGAEYYAFQGAKNMLREGLIDVILFEVNHTMKRYQLKSSQLYDLLAKHGYYLSEYKVNENKLTKLEGEINMGIQKNYFAARDVSKVNKRLKEKCAILSDALQ